MIQIVAGKWKGKSLRVPKNVHLRPTASRVKAAIFNIIEAQQMKRGLAANLNGLRCADLFAGVGGLGFEALSRGAVFCLFVEIEQQNLTALKRNMEDLGCRELCKIFPLAVEAALPRLAKQEKFDLLFIDPPYELATSPKILEKVSTLDLLSENGLIIFEHSPREEIPCPAALVLHSHRVLGPAAISVFTR